MTNDEGAGSVTSAQRASWEPDWIDLGAAMLDTMQEPTPYGTDHTEKIVRAVVESYRRQQSAQGFADVRIEALRECYRLLQGTDGGGISELRQELAEAVARSLATAMEGRDAR